MGVKSLWTLLHTLARPINLESLAGKRLAVDASIWLNQFTKVADLYDTRQFSPHVAGFFKRICKLLFYNIKPVFVFDGKPPDIKLQTIVLLLA
jgi:DNA excision repair protein ERCC-5